MSRVKIRPVLLLSAWTLSACGSNASQVELRQVRERVEAMQGQLARYDTQMVELQNQVFLITDQHQRERADAEAKRPPPHLRVVKLQPPVINKARVAEPSHDDVVDIDIKGDDEPPRLSVARVPPPAPIARHAASEADGLFRDALKAFREGRGADAAKLFSRFVDRYPDHAQGDMALYWMGEARFEATSYAEAVAVYRRLLLRYPRSSKVADALFRMGTAYERLGSQNEARQAFSDLVSNYPRSALADLAKARLAAEVGGTK